MKRLPEIIVVLMAVAVAAYWFRPEAAPTRLGLEGKSILLLAVREEDRPLLETAESLRRNTGVDVRTMFRATDVSPWWSAERSQLDADRVLGFAESGAQGPTLLLVGQDCYTSGKPEWRYCYGVRGEKSAVLSLARLDTASRRDKMMARYAAELLLGVRRSQDPTSLFYSPILGPGDIDRMELRIP